MLNAEDLDSEKLANINKQLEQYKELKKIRLDPETKNKTKATLSASLRDKAVAEEREFQHRGEKSSGMSSGYVATETETGETFILKTLHKSQRTKHTEQDAFDRRDNVQELMAANMYQLLLYDRAPKVALVKSSDANLLQVRSKFFSGVEQLSVFSGGTPGGSIGVKRDLADLEGFEKVMAACHILGELDYHAGNLMVQNDQTITKIDHGRSFGVSYLDFSSMIHKTNERFDQFGYKELMKSNKLKFNIEKYSESLKQMSYTNCNN
jgi:hypothetical protein